MFLVDFEQHDIDIMFIRLHFTNSLLLHAPETHVEEVSYMLFVNSTKYLFSERMVILLSHLAIPSAVLIQFPLENVCSKQLNSLTA